MLRFKWCSRENIKSVEEFYRRQSLKGYHLKDCILHLSEFTKASPKSYEYFLVDCTSLKQKQAAKECYSMNGCEYVCSRSNLLVFRKEAEQITEKDIDLRIYQYKKCAKRDLTTIIFLLVWAIFYILIGVFPLESKDPYLSAFEFAFLVPLIEECVFLFFDHRNYITSKQSDKMISIGVLRFIELLSCIFSFLVYVFLFAVKNS